MCFLVVSNVCCNTYMNIHMEKLCTGAAAKLLKILRYLDACTTNIYNVCEMLCFICQLIHFSTESNNFIYFNI